MLEEEKFILSLDVGTTTVRSFLYNKQGKHIPFIFLSFVGSVVPYFLMKTRTVSFLFTRALKSREYFLN